MLQWTRREQSILIEDDYDSEFRFSGKPLPAIKGLAASEHVSWSAPSASVSFRRCIEAGLNTPAYLLNSMTSQQAADRARRRNLEVWPLDRHALARNDIRGLLLGFAALTERQIRAGVAELARALIMSCTRATYLENGLLSRRHALPLWGQVLQYSRCMELISMRHCKT